MRSLLLAAAYCACMGLLPPALSAAAEIPLLPTAAAPVGAGGTASFEGGNGGTGVAVHVQRLSPGLYWLSAVRKSSPAPALLGPFTIVNPGASPDRQAAMDQRESSSTYGARFLSTRVSASLPPGLAPADIAEIDVIGPDGTILLAGKMGVSAPALPVQVPRNVP